MGKSTWASGASALVGVAVGFAAVAALVPTPAGIAPSPAPALEVPPTARPPSPEPRPAAPSGPGAPAAAAEPARPVDAEAARHAPPADRWVTGRVLDWRGNPVAGVLIVAEEAPIAYQWAERNDFAGGPPSNAALEQEQRARLRAARRRSVRGRTGEDGRFRLEGLTGEIIRLRALHDDYVAEMPIAWRPWQRPLRPNADVHFVATRARKVEIRPTLPDGTTPREAVLKIVDSSGAPTGTRILRWTRDHPSVRLAHGGYTISAVSGRPRPTRFWYESWNGEFESSHESFTVAAGEPAGPIELPMEAAAGLSVTVRARIPTGTDDIMLRAVALAEGEDAAAARVTSDDLEGVAEHGGRSVTFYGLAPGRYVVAALRDEGDTEVARGVFDVSTGIATGELALPDPPRAQLPAEVISVRATGPDGSPVLGAHFRLEVGRSNKVAAVLRSGPDGTYTVAVPAGLIANWNHPHAGRRWVWTLVLRHAAYADAVRSRVDPAGTETVTFDLSRLATLKVRFPALSDSDYAEGVRYVLTRPGASWQSVWSGRSHQQSAAPAADGSLELPPRLAGEWDLWILHPPPMMWSGPMPRAGPCFRVTLEPGANTFDVPSLGRSTLVVELTGETPRRLHLFSGPTREWGSRTAKVVDRVAKFEHLNPGRYWLGGSASAPEDLLEVAVPEQRTVQYLWKRPNALRVRYDARRWFATHGLQGGDVIVGYDDVEISDIESLTEAARDDVEGEVTVHLIRDGKHVSVKVPAKRFFNAIIFRDGFDGVRR